MTQPSLYHESVTVKVFLRKKCGGVRQEPQLRALERLGVGHVPPFARTHCRRGYSACAPHRFHHEEQPHLPYRNVLHPQACSIVSSRILMLEMLLLLPLVAVAPGAPPGLVRVGPAAPPSPPPPSPIYEALVTCLPDTPCDKRC